jgi:hypothetical protein
MDLDSYNGIMDNTNGVYSYRSIHGSKILYAGETKADNGIKPGYSLFRYMKKEDSSPGSKS